MSITARCGDCHQLFRLDDKWAGKKVRCKKCGGVITVPQPSDPAPDELPPELTAPPVQESSLGTAADEAEDDLPISPAHRLVTKRMVPPRWEPLPPRPAPAEIPAEPQPASIVPAADAGAVTPGPAAEPITPPDLEEELQESALPELSVGLWIASYLVPVVLTIVHLSNPPAGVVIDWGKVGIAAAQYLGLVVGSILLVLGVMIPATALAVRIAGGPGGAAPHLYRLCRPGVCLAAAACIVTVSVAIWRGMAPPLVLALSVAVAVIVLALALRSVLHVRGLAFLVAAGMASLLALLLPAAAIYLGTRARPIQRMVAVNLTRPMSEGGATQPVASAEGKDANQSAGAATNGSSSAAPASGRTAVTPGLPAASSANVEESRARLGRIFNAMRAFSLISGGRLPQSLEQLVLNAGLSRSNLSMPGDGAYVYLYRADLKFPISDRVVLIHEPLGSGPEDSRLVLMGDGSIESVPGSRFEEVIRQSMRSTF